MPLFTVRPRDHLSHVDCTLKKLIAHFRVGRYADSFVLCSFFLLLYNVKNRTEINMIKCWKNYRRIFTKT